MEDDEALFVVGGGLSFGPDFNLVGGPVLVGGGINDRIPNATPVVVKGHTVHSKGSGADTYSLVQTREG